MHFLATLSLGLLALSAPQRPAAAVIAPRVATQASQASAATALVLLTPAQLETLLPATVYFRGRTAPIQLRNAAGVRFGPDGYVLAVIVDTSGYASNVQEKYQVYLITETALRIAGQHLNPGAYGAGIVNGKLLLMDIGGHNLLQGETTLDEAMPRPRPLQITTTPNGELRLYLGRTWFTVAADDKP